MKRLETLRTGSLPATYYINLDVDVDKRMRMEEQLGRWASRVVRVPALDSEQVFECLSRGSCATDPRAKVLGRDYINTDGDLYWELHIKGVYSPQELGCSFSHIKAINQAYMDDEQTALIMEVICAQRTGAGEGS